MTRRHWGYVAALGGAAVVVALVGRLVAVAGATTGAQATATSVRVIIQPAPQSHRARGTATAVARRRQRQVTHAAQGGKARIETLLAAAGAAALHMTPKEFTQAIKTHTTLTALAAGHGTSVSNLRAAMLRSLKVALTKAVKDQKLSAAAARRTYTRASRALRRLK